MKKEMYAIKLIALAIFISSIVNCISFLQITNGPPGHIIYNDLDITTTTQIYASATITENAIDSPVKSCTFYLDGEEHATSEPTYYNEHTKLCRLDEGILLPAGYHTMRISFDGGNTIHDPKIIFVYSHNKETDLSVIQENISPHGTDSDAYDGIPFVMNYRISDASGIIQDLEYYVTWHVDGKEYARQRVLQKRPRDHLVAQEFLLEGGVHTISISIDVENALHESNENNNEHSMEINVFEKHPGKKISISMIDPFRLKRPYPYIARYHATYYVANIGEDDIAGPLTIRIINSGEESNITIPSLNSGEVLAFPVSCSEKGRSPCAQTVEITPEISAESFWEIYSNKQGSLYGFVLLNSNDPTATIEALSFPSKICSNSPFKMEYYVTNAAYLSDKHSSNTPELTTDVLIDGREIYSASYSLNGEKRQLFSTPKISLEEGCHNFYVTADSEDALISNGPKEEMFYGDGERYGLICAENCLTTEENLETVEELDAVETIAEVAEFKENQTIAEPPDVNKIDGEKSAEEESCLPAFVLLVGLVGLAFRT